MWLCVLQAIRLNHRKDPAVVLNEDNLLLADGRAIYSTSPRIYPFAIVLRLRVLQVSLYYNICKYNLHASKIILM